MNSPLTVRQAAQKLNLSETTIRNYLNTGKLERKTLNGKHYVTAKSIKALENKKGVGKETNSHKWPRRTFLATIGIASLSPFYNKVIVEWLADSYGSNTIDTDIKDLFGFWNELNLFPGSAHPKFKKGFHPDVAEAQNSISSLMETSGKVEFRPLNECLKLPSNENYLLVGGPISNELSRKLHGYSLNGQKISNNPVHTNKFRWHFHYPNPSADDVRYSRFVNGAETSTQPKAIVDKLATRGNRKYILPQIYPGSERISTDYLLITVVENIINGYSTGKHLIDVADLNGQGNKAFAMIMADKERRKELKNSVNEKPYFQALYEVEVLHDDFNKITSLGKVSLRDIHLLS